MAFQPKQEIASLLLLFILSIFSKHWKTEGAICSCGGGSKLRSGGGKKEPFSAVIHPPREAATSPTLYSLVSLTLIQRFHLSKYPTPTVPCLFFNDLWEEQHLSNTHIWTQNTTQQEPLWQNRRPKFSPSQLQAQVIPGLGGIGPVALLAKLQTGPRAFQPGWAVWLWPSTTPQKPLRAVPSCLGETEAASKTKSYLYPVLIPRISLFAFPVRIYKL